MANKTVTVKSTGGDYTSLAAAITGEKAANANLTAAGMNGILTIECDDLGADDGGSGTISGFTVDSTHYVHIKAAMGQGHAGIWSTSKYRIVSGGTGLDIQQDYTRVTGLQLQMTGSSQWPSWSIYVLASNVWIDRCILRSTYSGDGSGEVLRGIYAQGGSGLIVSNCLIYDYKDTAANAAGLALNWNGATVVNTTFYNCDLATHPQGGGTLTNALSVACTTTNFSGWTETTNATSATFADASGSPRDLRLAAATASGTDLGSTYVVDVSGDTRAGTWHIGADQYVAGASFKSAWARGSNQIIQ